MLLWSACWQTEPDAAAAVHPEATEVHFCTFVSFSNQLAVDRVAAVRPPPPPSLHPHDTNWDFMQRLNSLLALPLWNKTINISFYAPAAQTNFLVGSYERPSGAEISFCAGLVCWNKTSHLVVFKCSEMLPADTLQLKMIFKKSRFSARRENVTTSVFFYPADRFLSGATSWEQQQRGGKTFYEPSHTLKCPSKCSRARTCKSTSSFL